MSGVTIRVSSSFFGSTIPVNQVPKPKRVSIKQTVGNKSVSLPFGPVRVSYDGLGLKYINIDRPNDVALLEATSRKTRTVSMDLLIADSATSGGRSIQDTLDTLEDMATDDVDCLFVYGVRTLPFKMRISNLSYESARRDLDGNILQAVVNLQLDERPARKTTVVSLSAIEYDPPPKGGSSSTKKTKAKTTTSDDRPAYPPPDVTITGPSGIVGYPF